VRKKWLSDGWTPLVLLGLGGLYAAWVSGFRTAPFEDAAILMRYARHLAEGKGIVWNPGEMPLDGATDFLFMAMLAGLHHLGLAIETSVLVMGIGAHLATGLGIYLFLQARLSSLPRMFAAGIAGYFLLGPGLWLTNAYFGTAVFAGSLVLSWSLALQLMAGKQGPWLSWSFALACLLSGLIRPEGVLLSGLMLLSVIGANPGAWQRVLVPFVAVFAVLGGSYFIWRWGYFGAPLPHPFYKKGGGYLYPYSLMVSVTGTVKMCWPLLIPLIWSFFTPRWKQVLIYSLPLIGGVLMWVLLSDEMNFGYRFQYPLLGIACLSVHPFLRFKEDLFSGKQLALGLVLLALVLFNGRLSKGIRLQEDGRYHLARELQQFATKGYRMATTEAGLLPYYSEWTALDTWGLNDRHIAHQGYLDQDYLESWNPDLVLFHGDLTQHFPLSASEHSGSWKQMNNTLLAYVKEKNYTLAAAYGISPYFVHFYYVKTENPDHDQLVKLIRDLPTLGSPSPVLHWTIG
jgi:arabinofuranosyltransferase